MEEVRQRKTPKPTARNAIAFEPIGGAKVSADAKCIMLNDMPIGDDDALRLAQTLIEAHMWKGQQRIYEWM